MKRMANVSLYMAMCIVFGELSDLPGYDIGNVLLHGMTDEEDDLPVDHPSLNRFANGARPVTGELQSNVKNSSDVELNKRIMKLRLNTIEDAARVFDSLFLSDYFVIDDEIKNKLQDIYATGDCCSFLASILRLSMDGIDREKLSDQDISRIQEYIGEIKEKRSVQPGVAVQIISREEYVNSKSRESAKQFAKGYESVLFADEGDETPKRLCDVYQPPMLMVGEKTSLWMFKSFAPFKYMRRNRFISVQYSNQIQIEGLIFDNNDGKGCKRFVIVGQPGMGKTSLVRFMANEYLSNDSFADYSLFFISGKEIRNSEGNPYDDFCKALGVYGLDLDEKTVIILDAFDEISYVSESYNNRSSYIEKLDEAVGDSFLLITTRPGYGPEECYATAVMTGFDEQRIKNFLTDYYENKKIDSDIKKRIISECIEAYNNLNPGYNAKELLSIPMLLYIIAAKRLHIMEYHNRFELFERLFKYDGHGYLVERGRDEEKKESKKLWKESFCFAELVAYSMFGSALGIVDEEEINDIISKLELADFKTDKLRNRFGIEVFLKEETEKEYCFVHKNIQEYFAAKYLSRRFCEIVDGFVRNRYDQEKSIRLLGELFGDLPYSPIVFEFIVEDMKLKKLNYNNKDWNNIFYLYGRLMNDFIPLKKYDDLDISRYTIKQARSYIERYHLLMVWINNVISILYRKNNEKCYEFSHAAEFLIRGNDMHRGFELYFTNICFAKVDFTKMPLGKIGFLNCSFQECTFDGADLSDCEFCGKTEFIDVDLANANLTGVRFERTLFKDCDLFNTVLYKAAFNDSVFENCRHEDTNMNDTVMDESTKVSYDSDVERHLKQEWAEI